MTSLDAGSRVPQNNIGPPKIKDNSKMDIFNSIAPRKGIALNLLCLFSYFLPMKLLFFKVSRYQNAAVLFAFRGNTLLVNCEQLLITILHESLEKKT